MIRRLSATITAFKECVYRHGTMRRGLYLLALLGLLLFWLYARGEQVAFVYSAF